MIGETKTTEYDQLSLDTDPKYEYYGAEHNLVLRKKPKTDDELKEGTRGFDCLEQKGILSAYDFVYPVSKQLCCDPISVHAATLIVQTVEFKLRQIIEEAIKLAYHRGSCASPNLQKNGGLPFISLRDINSAMRYICGSKDLIWSSEKSPRRYLISCLEDNKDQVVTETNAETFYNLHERSIKYIPCFSLPYESVEKTSKVNSLKDSNDPKEIFHNIMRDLNGEKIGRSTIHLHWLAVEGKFVLNSENDIKYIKRISNIETNSKFLKVKATHGADNDESSDQFKVVINKAVEGFLNEEQREFLSYMNRMFTRGMDELNSSFSFPSSTNILKSNTQRRTFILNNFVDTYGLSEKDIGTVASVWSLYEGSNSLELHKSNDQQSISDFKQSDDSNGKGQTHSKEHQRKIELILKLNDIFYILETNTDFEPLLPYLVYYFNYNTQVICNKFEKTGELPKIGSLGLLLRICRSIIRNPHCSNTAYYIHKIIESLIRIMVSCPIREVVSNLDLKISTFFLIDNLNARLDASNLLESIIEMCCHHLPVGIAKILEYLSNEFQALLDTRLNNLTSGNCLQITSLYGIVCGIRSLGDFSISNVLFPKLLTIFCYHPEDHCSKISFLKLHLEISTLINRYVSLYNTIFEQSNRYNCVDIHFVYWEKLIESLEKILGDGVIPVLLTSDAFNHDKNSEKCIQAICFLDQCIKTYYIDSNIKCQSSKDFSSITDKRRHSDQYIENFIRSYKDNSNYKGHSYNRCFYSDLYSIKSMLSITI